MIKNISNKSLQTKIMLMFFVMSVVLTFFLGVAFYKNTYNNYSGFKRTEMITLAKETANKIDRFLFERNADLKVLADSKIFSMDNIPSEAKQSYINNVVKAYNTYDSISLIDDYGSVILTTKIDKNIGISNDILKRIITNESYISDFIYDEKTEKYFLVFSKVIVNKKNKKMGYIVEKMNFASISEIIEGVKIGKTGYAILEKTIESENENQYGNIIIDGHKFIRAIHPIKKYYSQKNGWLVSVIQPYNEAFSIMNDIEKYFFFVIIISIVLLFAFSLLISSQITKPIKNLMNRMSKFTLKNEKYSSSNITSNEIRKLTDSFDILLEELEFMMQRVLEKSGESIYIEEIRKSFDLLFKSMPNGIITVDSKGNIRSINDVALKILDVSEDEFVNKNLYNDFGEKLKNFTKALSISLESDNRINEKICYLTSSKDELIPFVFSTLKQTDFNGNLIGLTVVIRNLEDKRRFEESISRAKKLTELGELSAGVAHEIRNPLASIKGYAQIALYETKENKQLNEDISIILSEVDRLDQLIERFLNFANPNKPNYDYCHINKILKETVEIIGHDFGKKNIYVNFDLDKNDLIEIDYGQIKQVMINIILNSVQAMPKGGNLDISSFYFIGNDMLEIHIKDTGDGIEKDKIEDIFKPFFTTRSSGTGLGLAICSRIIEYHNGVIEVESIKNEGSKFIIKIPARNGVKSDV